MKRKSLILLVAAAVTLGLAQPASADDTETVTATETAQALASVPGVLASSDAVQTASDANSAATSTVAGTTVDAPRDASDGVTLQSSGAPAMKIELPNADEAASGTVVAPGTVAYPATNGSANAVQATETGGVRMLTVISSTDAPQEYTYKVDVPGGGSIRIGDDGGAIILDGAGQAVAGVAVPWAKDATGAAVPTHFTVSTDGQHLTQVVEHGIANVAYPVTSDPFFDFIGNILRTIWNGALGCVGGKEIVEKGVRKFLTWNGAKLILSRLGTKFVPYVGWVSCGYGAWQGIRS